MGFIDKLKGMIGGKKEPGQPAADNVGTVPGEQAAAPYTGQSGSAAEVEKDAVEMPGEP